MKNQKKPYHSLKLNKKNKFNQKKNWRMLKKNLQVKIQKNKFQTLSKWIKILKQN